MGFSGLDLVAVWTMSLVPPSMFDGFSWTAWGAEFSGGFGTCLRDFCVSGATSVGVGVSLSSAFATGLVGIGWATGLGHGFGKVCVTLGITGDSLWSALAFSPGLGQGFGRVCIVLGSTGDSLWSALAISPGLGQGLGGVCIVLGSTGDGLWSALAITPGLGQGFGIDCVTLCNTWDGLWSVLDTSSAPSMWAGFPAKCGVNILASLLQAWSSTHLVQTTVIVVDCNVSTGVWLQLEQAGTQSLVSPKLWQWSCIGWDIGVSLWSALASTSSAWSGGEWAGGWAVRVGVFVGYSCCGMGVGLWSVLVTWAGVGWALGWLVGVGWFLGHTGTWSLVSSRLGQGSCIGCGLQGFIGAGLWSALAPTWSAWCGPGSSSPRISVFLASSLWSSLGIVPGGNGGKICTTLYISWSLTDLRQATVIVVDCMANSGLVMLEQKVVVCIVEALWW